MDTLLQVGLSNAAVATVLALIAAAGSILWRRRPALVHGLWLLVLLKLLTPPLARVPVPNPLPAVAPTAVANGDDALPSAAPTAPVPVAEATPLADGPFVARAFVDDGETDTPAVTDAPALAAALPADDPVCAATAIPFELPPWQPTLVLVWVGGSAGWFLLAGMRLLRFVRLLRYAVPASDAVQDQADRIATTLGMGWCPLVQLLPGRLPPMVWAGLGTPRLLLPLDLLGQMGAEGVSTLMAHELAHLKRGDHRVRLVEFLAMGLFWWLPVVWVARRALREAEEQCCDAWVVSALPGRGKAYAAALLETLDFLAAAPASPPLACGVGQVSDLKRRLTMIMRGATPRALCWREGLAVLGLATVLPLLPTLARADGDEQSEPAKQAKKAEERKLFIVRADDNNKSPEVERTKAELKRLEAELQKKLAEVREVSQRLKETAEKIHHVEMERAQNFARDMTKDLKERISKEMRERIGKEIRVEVDGKELKNRKMILEGPIEIEVTVDGQTHVRRIDGAGRVHVHTHPNPQPTPTPAAPVPPAPAASPAAPAAPAAPSRVATPRHAEGREGRDNREGDRRMDQLERRLDAVMRELEKLRQEKAESQRSKEKHEDKVKERTPAKRRSADKDKDDDDDSF